MHFPQNASPNYRPSRVTPDFLTHRQTAKVFGRQAACNRRRAGAKSKSLQSKLFLPKNVSISCHCEDRAKTGRRFCSKTPASGQNRPFSKQKRPDLVSLRGRIAAVAILKFEVWHPAPKHGSTKQEEVPITKNMDSPLHSASSPFIYGSVSFRSTIVRYGMANRFVKDCRVGRKSCALLAMTRLIGFAGKRNNFRNETFERRCGATPRKK